MNDWACYLPDHRAGLVRDFFALISNGGACVVWILACLPLSTLNIFIAVWLSRENNVATIFHWASSVFSVNRY